MKNLRKLTRTDLKELKGGYIKADGGGDTFRCCNTSTGSCGPCGGPGACDAGYELRSC
ncbi:hypothetical protein J2810_000207 [Chryseobacterium rhizosphaerae]|uniref:bacteriocin-like protein n=1 Tax=Chryseobacterium rhizosphaerae TaxID=395937 RepID=UPI00285AEE37|nr:hypothetical protein [Chryseobacterium rhizosphaerae]MDR6544185.1 hypothetical protein [Chryseobacterium rhizosphaerae]